LPPMGHGVTREIVAVGELLDYWECYEEVVPPARDMAQGTLDSGHITALL
jgi:hypothetical protein